MTADEDRPGDTKRRSDPAPDAGGSVAGPTRFAGGERSDSRPESGPTVVYPSSGSDAGISDGSRSRGLAAGVVLFGEYEIEKILGSGGMGEVYKARHRALDEYRAIKILHTNISDQKTSTTLFLREAKALLSVRHPAVVHCHDLLSDDEGRVFLIMELIDGRPLSHRLAEGPLSMDEVVTLGGRLSSGLRAAHRKGVVHRDVSPDNVVLEDGDVSRAKLIDFGIAKILEEGQGTVVDGFKGKLSYASPEQLGFFGGRIDGRSDLYSLGLVLCASAMGQPLSMGTTVMEAVDARRNRQGLPEGIPIGLRSALEPLLALDPADRPEMAERLFLAPDAAASTTSRSMPYRTGSPRRASYRLRGLATAAALILLGLLAYHWWPAAAVGPQMTEVGTEPTEMSAEPMALTNQPLKSEEVLEATTVESEPRPEAVRVVAETQPAPNPLGELQIIGLLRGAREALSENRLRRPAGNNAYQRYQAVLKLDPSNAAAKQGLIDVSGRYLQLSERALAGGDVEKAERYFRDAVKVAPEHPLIPKLKTALSGARQ